MCIFSLVFHRKQQKTFAHQGTPLTTLLSEQTVSLSLEKSLMVTLSVASSVLTSLDADAWLEDCWIVVDCWRGIVGRGWAETRPEILIISFFFLKKKILCSSRKKNLKRIVSSLFSKRSIFSPYQNWCWCRRRRRSRSDSRRTPSSCGRRPYDSKALRKSSVEAGMSPLAAAQSYCSSGNFKIRGWC